MCEPLSLPAAASSPVRGNNDDRRQWRKQGGVVGAAASRTQVQNFARSGRWEPQPVRWHCEAMTVGFNIVSTTFRQEKTVAFSCSGLFSFTYYFYSFHLIHSISY